MHAVAVTVLFVALAVATPTAFADPRYPQHYPTHQQPTHHQQQPPSYHPSQRQPIQQPVRHHPQVQQPSHYQPGPQWRPGNNYDRRHDFNPGWRNLGHYRDWGELREWHQNRIWWRWRPIENAGITWIFIAIDDWSDEVAWHYQSWGMNATYALDGDGNIIGVYIRQPW